MMVECKWDVITLRAFCFVGLKEKKIPTRSRSHSINKNKLSCCFYFHIARVSLAELCHFGRTNAAFDVQIVAIVQVATIFNRTGP